MAKNGVLLASRQEGLQDLTRQKARTSDGQGSQHKHKKDLSGPRKKEQVVCEFNRAG